MKKNYMRLIVALLFATNLMAQNVPNYVPTNGLVGWWPFNGNANDESGNGNHGTVNGATLTSDRNGKTNSAYRFDGKSFISSNQNNFPIGNNSRTVSCWFKLEKEDLNFKMILSYGNYSASNLFAIGFYQKTNEFYFSNHSNALFKRKLNLNQLYNITITYNGSDYILYIDGVYVTSEKAITNTTSGFFYIGKDPGGGNFIGLIDDIAIFNRALTQEEITALYKGCTKETATSTSFNSYVFTNNAPINLSATPIGGTFSGDGIVNNAFNPKEALLGKNAIKYNFKNTSGCADSTDFSMIMVDTVGNVCKKTVNDTVSILKIHFQLTTGIKANTVTNITVYPNPTSDVLIIDATDSQALAGYTYRILDVQGKQIYNALVTSSKTEITLKTLGTKGVYVLHIVDANGISIENKKIVLQ